MPGFVPASLDMRNGDLKLSRRQCSGQRRVRVSIDHRDRRILGAKNGLELRHHPPGLSAMGTRPDAQVIIRGLNPKLAEEDVRHLFIVMLSRVNQNLSQSHRGPLVVESHYGSGNRTGFDELRPASDDRDNLEFRQIHLLQLERAS